MTLHISKSRLLEWERAFLYQVFQHTSGYIFTCVNAQGPKLQKWQWPTMIFANDPERAYIAHSYSPSRPCFGRLLSLVCMEYV
jgi:hypothetical protein